MLVKTVFAALAAAGMVTAHIEMTSPYPIRSQHDPQNDWSNIDYSMTSPLNADGSNFPCKGYHKNTPFRATAQYQAGSSYSMSLSGGATHSGGSCQLSLSYDNGATFKVIKSMEGGCPLTNQYDFTIPSSAPSGDALFAWTWFNLEGNREMYMNCADVTVQGGSGGGSWSSLPDLFVANVGNGCNTVEGKHTVFANPGNDVVYGQGLGPNSPVFPNC